MDHLPSHYDGGSNAVAVLEPASGITKDDANEGHPVGFGADEVTANGHTKIRCHCIKHHRRYRYWFDALSDRLAIQTAQFAHLVDYMERALGAVLMEPVSNNEKSAGAGFYY